MRVQCRKHRLHTSNGEDTDCVFLAYPLEEGAGGGPVAVERWRSVSVELYDFSKLSKAVQATRLPEGAIVTGYPGIVADIAGRAWAAHAAAGQGGAGR